MLLFSVTENLSSTQEYNLEPALRIASQVSKGEQMLQPKLKKIVSVLRDAQTIAGIVDRFDIDTVYERLNERRSEPNRVEIVTNQILEDVAFNQDGLVQEMIINTAHGTETLLEDFVDIVDKTMSVIPALPKTADEIRQMLAREKHRPDRVDRVVAELLKHHYDGIRTTKIDRLTADANTVMSVLDLPFSMKVVVLDLLEKSGPDQDRVDKVVLYLQDQAATNSNISDILPVNNDAFKNDPLFKDMHLIAKVIPDADPNEIYAFLEAHHDRKDRIKIVIEEFLRFEPSTQPTLQKRTSISEFMLNFEEPCIEKGGIAKMPSTITEEVDNLREIFPDCDPHYLFEELEKLANDQDRVKTVAMALFENNKYPTHKDALKRKEKEEMESKLANLRFDIDDFCKRFPDPKSTFEQHKTSAHSENYKEHVVAQILNDFKEIKTGFLHHILRANNYRYTNAYAVLKSRVDSLKG